MTEAPDSWLGSHARRRGEAAPCGEAEAYISEFTPGATYQVLLFVTASNGTKQIGTTAEFTVTPALPR